MKDFFKTSSFKVLAIVVVVLLGLIIYTATAGGSLLASLLGFATTPMQSVSTQATGAVTEFVDLDALSMGQLHRMGQTLPVEVARKGPHSKGIPRQIHCVRTIGQGHLQPLHIPRWGEQLRFTRWTHTSAPEPDAHYRSG